MGDIDKIKKDLEALDKEIETAENEKMQLQGRIIQAKESLKNNFNIETIEQGEFEIERLKTSIEKLKIEIDEVYTKLKSEYDW